MPPIVVVDLAEKMFAAYNAQGPNPNKTHDGKDVPPWGALGEQVQGKWLAAARCAAEYAGGEGAGAAPEAAPTRPSAPRP